MNVDHRRFLHALFVRGQIADYDDRPSEDLPMDGTPWRAYTVWLRESDDDA